MPKKLKKVETPEQKSQRIANMHAANAAQAVRVREAKAKGTDITVDPQLKQAEIAYASLLALAREDCSLFCELILRDEETGDIIQNTWMHEEWHLKANSLNEHGQPQNMIIWAHPEAGKAVPLTTEIPTPSGWTTMGELQVGDRVYRKNGKPCTVTWVSPVQHGRDVYRLTFADGDSVLADADHQWVAAQGARGVGWRTVTTRQMLSGTGWTIPVCSALRGWDVAITALEGTELYADQLVEYYRSKGRIAKKMREVHASTDAEGNTVETVEFYAAALPGFRRRIVSIKQVPSVPVKCIGVDASDRMYLMTRSYTVTHNSQQLAIGRSLWLLGKNPRYRVAILAAAEKQAKKLIDSLRKHIESNEVLHQIFPQLKRGDLWQDNAITVERTGIIKDPSVQVVSPGGKVQGARIDVLVIDDVLVEDNTRTAYLREKTATWIRTSAFSRMSRRGQIIMLANAFHPDDFAHVLAKEGGFWSKKYPVLLPDGTSAWPERWPMERINQKRTADGMGPTEFGRMYMCEPRNDGDARFKGEWIELCKAKGEGWPLFRDLKSFIEFVGPEYWMKAGILWGDIKSLTWRNLPPGFLTVTGVDLGVSRKDSADPTVVFTILVWPDGTRHPLNIQRGKFSSPEIMQQVVDAHTRFHSICIVEDNGAQDYLLQGLRQDYPDMPVRGFRTGRNKHQAYGVESVGGEMSEGRWLIPSSDGKTDPVISVWLTEMLYYTAKGHTGDALMASWFAREGARAFHSVDTGSGISVSVIG